MIISTVNEYESCEAVKKIRPENFSYEGRRTLFNYLEDLSEDTGESIELDVIALCCEFSEYKSFEEIKNKYEITDIEELEDNTTVIPIEGTEGLIIKDY